MKKITLMLALFFAGMIYAQNQSDGTVQPSITSPIPQQFSGGEIFRFSKGLVTQLDTGSSFNFNNSRWFSFGRLNTGSQTVYGLRFQVPNRAITLGYQDVNDDNPRIQWIGDTTKSNLEFRSATSFTSTASNLNATMTFDGKTFFGKPLSFDDQLVGIDYSSVPNSNRTGLTVQNKAITNNYYTITGFKSLNNVYCNLKTGMQIESDGGAFASTGVNVSIRDGSYNTGVQASVQSLASGGSSAGVRGSVFGASGTTPTGFGAGIYGSSAATTNRYAGYFSGNVVVTGSFSSGSDRKLKDDITVEENMLEKLAQIDAVNYTFKPNEQLHLPTTLQHGFIAQNIEEVFPELVSTITKPVLDKDNKEIDVYEYKAVNYIGMISILTSSLKELNEQSTARINELTEQSTASINELNEKIASLESQLEALKGETTLDDQNDLGNAGFSMEQNKPNPFTNQTVVNYTLPSNTKATISVVDLSGKFIREYKLTSEKGQVTINSSDIGKGIFIYALISDNEVVISKKMIVR